MILTGIVLLLIGLFIGFPILVTLGVILLIVGVVFALLGNSGRTIGGRSHWY